MAGTQLDIVSEVQQLTAQIIQRVREGNATLTDLEESLLLMLRSNDLVKNDPAFLLEVCKYFRSSVAGESKVILDFIANIRQKMAQMPPPQPVVGGEVIDSMSPVERDQLRDQL